MHLSGLSLDNWQSSKRELARVNYRYSLIQPWVGREITDLGYHDQKGVFTQKLIGGGYLDAKVWERRDPDTLSR